MAEEWLVRAIEPGSREFAHAKEVRYRELYQHLGLGRALVEEASDAPPYIHVAAFDGDRVVGYARLLLEGGESKVGQVCVDGAYRGRGVATALMADVIARARTAGRADVHLDARDSAVGFYERLGFVAEGETFLSPRTHTPHRVMRLHLG